MIRIANSLYKLAQTAQTEQKDLSSASSDITMSVGESAFINYSSATTIPLRITTNGGLYRIRIIGDRTVSVSASGDILLNPNSTTYSSAFTILMVTRTGATTGGLNTTIANSFWTSQGGRAEIIDLLVNTGTKAKTITGTGASTTASALSHFSVSGIWVDTTTAWSSLGDIVFSFAQSGKIVIAREA